MPAGAAQNGSHFYLSLPNSNANVDKYVDHSSSLRLWYLELASVRDKCLTFVNFGNISLRMGPLWNCHLIHWLSIAGSKHNLTFPFGFGTSTLLLHQSAVSFMPIGVMISSWCSHSSSSLNGFCNVQTTCHGGGCYSLLLCFTFCETLPLKHYILVNASLNSLCICCVISAPASHQLLVWGLEWK